MISVKLKKKFEEVVLQLPSNIIVAAKIEQRSDCVGLNWDGGSLFFGENRGVGEFSLHIFDEGSGQEKYLLYPVFSKNSSADSEEKNEIIKDLFRFQSNLINK